MAYGYFNDLPRRTASDKVLRDKAVNIAKNPTCGAYEREPASVVYNFFEEKSAAKTLGGGAKIGTMPNQQLAIELNKSIIRRSKKHKWHSSFKDI